MFFMPRRTMVCEKVFQEEGIFADVTLSEYPLDFIPFDSDILSLELDTAYKASFCPDHAVPLSCFCLSRLLLYCLLVRVLGVYSYWVLAGPLHALAEQTQFLTLP